jgi:hypothetical protein
MVCSLAKSIHQGKDLEHMFSIRQQRFDVVVPQAVAVVHAGRKKPVSLQICAKATSAAPFQKMGAFEKKFYFFAEHTKDPGNSGSQMNIDFRITPE